MTQEEFNKLTVKDLKELAYDSIVKIKTENSNLAQCEQRIAFLFKEADTKQGA